MRPAGDEVCSTLPKKRVEDAYHVCREATTSIMRAAARKRNAVHPVPTNSKMPSSNVHLIILVHWRLYIQTLPPQQIANSVLLTINRRNWPYTAAVEIAASHLQPHRISSLVLITPKFTTDCIALISRSL